MPKSRRQKLPAARREKLPPSVPAPAEKATLLRIAIAIRPALFREGLARLLSAEAAFEVVGEATDEAGITELLRRKRPRVLLFDYEALGAGGEEMIARLRRAVPGTRYLVLATRSGPETVERVLRAGAAGLVGKELDFDTVARAIRAVAEGEIWANRLVTAKALEYLSGLPTYGSQPDRHLTRREAEIASEVGLGLRNKEIAAKLRISEKTVRTHLNNIFRKLHLNSRIDLALLQRDRHQPKS